MIKELLVSNCPLKGAVNISRGTCQVPTAGHTAGRTCGQPRQGRPAPSTRDARRGAPRRRSCRSPGQPARRSRSHSSRTELDRTVPHDTDGRGGQGGHGHPGGLREARERGTGVFRR